MTTNSGSYNPGVSVPKTVSVIKAEGDVKTKLIGAKVGAGIVIIMTVGGLAAIFFRPDNWKDYWVVLSPSITGITFALLGRQRS